MYTLDTNAVIYYSRDDENAVTVLQEIFVQNTPLYISAITEIELFGFPRLSAEEMQWIENFLQAVTVIPVDSRIARTAGSIRRRYRLKTLDSAIAATALATGTTLLTRNIKDFRNIPNLVVQKI